MPYDSASWDAWVKSGTAAALPSGVEFTAKARALGGRVVIVTNRDQTAPDSAFAEFGERFFALPNPMYGSREKNPLP